LKTTITTVIVTCHDRKLSRGTMVKWHMVILKLF